MIKSVKIKDYVVTIESTEGKIVVDFRAVCPHTIGLYTEEFFQNVRIEEDKLLWPDGLEFSLEELFQIGNRTKPFKHSPTFQKLVVEAATVGEKRLAIRLLTHSNPMLVFWVGPDRQVYGAGKAHRDNPPNGDKSIFGDLQHKGFLRGRIALIGDQLYGVVYRNPKDSCFQRWQQALLLASLPNLYAAIHNKNSSVEPEDTFFVDDTGEPIGV